MESLCFSCATLTPVIVGLDPGHDVMLEIPVASLNMTPDDKRDGKHQHDL